MKKQAFVIMLMGIIAGGFACAQDASVTLTDNETDTFYFTLDPVFSAAVTGADIYSALQRNQFTIIGAGGMAKLTALFAGSHAILGFWVSGGISQFGPFSLQFNVAAGQTKEFLLKKTARKW